MQKTLEITEIYRLRRQIDRYYSVQSDNNRKFHDIENTKVKFMHIGEAIQ